MQISKFFSALGFALMLATGVTAFATLSPQTAQAEVIDGKAFRSIISDQIKAFRSGDAAKALVRGLQSRGFEIHFPRQFTFIMKIIDVLPRWIYFPLSRLMRKKQ